MAPENTPVVYRRATEWRLSQGDASIMFVTVDYDSNMQSVWQTSVGGETSTVDVYQEAGVVVVTTDDGQWSVVDATTGRVRWSTGHGAVTAAGANAVYTVSRSEAEVVSWDAETGTERWRYAAPQSISQVVKAGETVGVSTFEVDTELDEDYMIVLDSRTGTERVSAQEDVRSIHEVDETLYFKTGNGIHAYENSGLRVFCEASDSGDVNVVFDDHRCIYFGCTWPGTGLLAVAKGTGAKHFETGGYTNDAVRDGDTVVTAIGRGSQSGAFDTHTGRSRWILNDTSWYTKEVVTQGDLIYFRANESFGEDDARVMAVTANDGSSVWSWRSKSLDSMSAVSGTVLIRGDDGVFGLDADTGDVLWQVGSATDYVTLDDAVFVHDDDRLHRVDPQTGTSLWSTGANAVAADGGLYVGDGSSLSRYALPGADVSAMVSTDTQIYDSGSDPSETTRVYDGDSGSDDPPEVYDPDGTSSGTTQGHDGSTPGADSIAYCPDCGRDLRAIEDRRYCPSCGRELGS
jgi:outer membrane protein assembly factor BamB